jgi:hypothetical protein
MSRTTSSRFRQVFLMAQEYAHSQGARHKNVGGYSWRPRKDRYTWEIRITRWGPTVTVYNGKTKQTVELGPAPEQSRFDGVLCDTCKI